MARVSLKNLCPLSWNHLPLLRASRPKRGSWFWWFLYAFATKHFLSLFDTFFKILHLIAFVCIFMYFLLHLRSYNIMHIFTYFHSMFATFRFEFLAIWVGYFGWFWMNCTLLSGGTWTWHWPLAIWLKIGRWDSCRLQFNWTSTAQSHAMFINVHDFSLWKV